MKPVALLPIALLIFSAAAMPSRAADTDLSRNRPGYVHRVVFGFLAHDVDHLWSGSKREGGVDINAEVVLRGPGVSIFSGNVRPNFGVSVNTQGDTSKLYAGFLWEIETRSGFFFNTGIGAAIHNGELDLWDNDKKALGSRVLFRIPFELGFQFTDTWSVSVMFDHVSNADLATDNEGMDTLGLRFGYRF